MISENRNENEKNDKTVHLSLSVITHKIILGSQQLRFQR